MTTLMKSLGIKEASDPKYVKTLMDEIDEDKDGVINLKEFFWHDEQRDFIPQKRLTKKLTTKTIRSLQKRRF